MKSQIIKPSIAVFILISVTFFCVSFKKEPHFNQTFLKGRFINCPAGIYSVNNSSNGTMISITENTNGFFGTYPINLTPGQFTYTGCGIKNYTSTSITLRASGNFSSATLVNGYGMSSTKNYTSSGVYIWYNVYFSGACWGNNLTIQ